MKKRIFIIAISLVLVLILLMLYYKFNSKNRIDTKYSNADVNQQTFDKVSMKIKEDTLTKTGATIVIVDENEELYSFGKGYTLEKNIFGNIWVELPLKSGYSEEPFYGHGANGITEMKIEWLEKYGELKKGKYKLVKVKDELYVEFSID